LAKEYFRLMKALRRIQRLEERALKAAGEGGEVSDETRPSGSDASKSAKGLAKALEDIRDGRLAEGARTLSSEDYKRRGIAKLESEMAALQKDWERLNAKAGAYSQEAEEIRGVADKLRAENGRLAEEGEILRQGLAAILAGKTDCRSEDLAGCCAQFAGETLARAGLVGKRGAYAYFISICEQPVEIRWSDEDRCYVARATELDGVTTHGETVEEATRMAQEAIELYLECRGER
jgi:predicted RNase H-like HicB family nuclease/FtsZ-binding cell division protein ZapB